MVLYSLQRAEIQNQKPHPVLDNEDVNTKIVKPINNNDKN